MSTLESHLNRQLEHSQRFFWNRLRWAAVSEYLPEEGSFTLVDVGAGPGFLGDFLDRSYPHGSYRFVEPIESLERELVAKFGGDANARCSDSYDGAAYVTLLDVLEHQADDREFLRDLAAKMQPGALLLLTVPAMPSLWSAWDEVLGHHRRYRKETLARATSGLPLEQREMSYLFPELLPPGWLRRVRRRASSARPGTDAAEFPDLPDRVNDALFGLGSLSLRLRRRWPAGTSLFAALERT